MIGQLASGILLLVRLSPYSFLRISIFKNHERLFGKRFGDGFALVLGDTFRCRFYRMA
jgi:hypothetical protein